MKEWAKHPIPGENKRLSLRWAIREFMLHQSFPAVTPADLARKREPNCEWIPQRYL